MAQNVTTQQLQDALQKLAKQLGLSTKEYIAAQNFVDEDRLNSELAKIQKQFDEVFKVDANDNVESIVEKINKINEILKDDEGAIQNILNTIQTTKADLQSAIDDVANKSKDLASKIEELTKTVGVNTDDINALVKQFNENKKTVADTLSSLQAELKNAKDTLATLTGDEKVKGSVKNLISEEAKRVDAALDGAKTELNNKIEAAKKDLEDKFQNEINSINNELNDTTDKDGNLVKGIKSRLTDAEKAIEAIEEKVTESTDDVLNKAKAYVDEKVLHADELDICAIKNAFRAALGLGEEKCGATETKQTNTSSAVQGDGTVV